LRTKHSAATPEYVAAVHEHGMRINPYTVNDPSLMRTLIANRVDGIISDRPDVLREEIRNARPAA
jgi:glycerophosphoryl diester phosphodiesterase